MIRNLKALLTVLFFVAATYQSAQALTPPPQLPSPIPPASATTTLSYGQTISISGQAGSVQYFRIAVTTGPYSVGVDVTGANCGSGHVTIDKLSSSPAGSFYTSTDLLGAHSIAMFNAAGYYYFSVRGNAQFAGKLKVTFNGFG